MNSRGQNGGEMNVGTSSGGNPVVPFLLGTAIGGLAGAVVGTLLSGHAAHLMATILDVVDRRDDQNKRRPKFEFMLQ